jgi:hypothetical protein
MSEGNWHHVSVRVRNRAPHKIECEQVEILRPRSAIMLGFRDATFFDKDKQRYYLKPDLASNTASEWW